MKTEYEVGDVVQLKSGSPRMVVTRVEGDDVSVAWVHYQSGRFVEATLRSACFVPASEREDRR